MSKMYILIGAPGSGKSHYIKEHNKDGIVISRDAIRFEMVKENEPYFSREKEVYNEFIRQIDAAVADNVNVWVDQTSINRAARNKLFSRLRKLPEEVIAIVIRPTLEKTLQQNALRTGRALVPEDAIINMYNSFEEPQFKEGFTMIIHHNVEEGVNESWQVKK